MKEQINLVTDDDEMNLDLMYPEEEDAPLKVRLVDRGRKLGPKNLLAQAPPTSETGASSLQPRSVVQEHSTNVAPTTISSSSVFTLTPFQIIYEIVNLTCRW